MIAKSFKSGHNQDTFLLALLLLITLVGLAILASASSEVAKLKFNDTYYYLKHQILYGLSLGIIGFCLGYTIHYQRFKKVALVLLLINLGLVALVFTRLGVTTGGASRWLVIGSFSFQPAELLKISFILYIAAWFSRIRTNRLGGSFKEILPFLIVSAVTALLLVLQPATSTVVILMMGAGAIYFISGARAKHILWIWIASVLILASIIVLTPYRLKRIISFLHPTQDSQGANYHRDQAMIAIGSGRIFGVGFGQSTAKVNNLPAVIDDSVFAVAAQELGFVGASFIIAFFGMLVFRLFWIARSVRDRFGKFVLIGFGTVIAFQSIVNMGAISGILPLTGVPLPFISYGGTALAVFLTMGGISLNISKYT